MEVRMLDGCISVQLDGKYFIVRNSEEITPRYDWLYRLETGVWVFELNGKYGFLDRTYKEIVPAKYTIKPLWVNGFAIMEVDGKETIINENLEEMIPLKYDCVEFFHEGMAKVQLNHKYGFVNEAGEEVIPVIYDDFCRMIDAAHCRLSPDFGYDPPFFQNGLVKAKLNGKWGIINEKNQTILPMKYDKILYEKSDFFKVILDGKIGLIKQNFHEIVEPKYDEIGEC